MRAEVLEKRNLLAAGIGLQAQYFDTEDLTGTPLVRTDAQVDFDWVAGSPDASIGADEFSARWSGQVEADFTETHTFIVNADDGARLWVNGQLLIDQFAASGVTEASADIDLIAGRRYDIQLEYREAAIDASIRLEWSSLSRVREVIPTSNLFAGERGHITGERYDSISGNLITALTSNAKYPDSPDSVAHLTAFATTPNSGDNYGQRIRGLLHAPTTGAYQFYIAADNHAELWLSNTADPWQKQKIAEVTSSVGDMNFTQNAEQQSGEIQLVAGQSYYIEALHKESASTDHLSVGWTQPGEAGVAVISGDYLSPVLPTVKIFANKPNVSEVSSAPASFTIVRSNASTVNALIVNYTTDGTATNGTDYVTLGGSVTIPAGQSSVTLDVSPLADSLVEGDETAIIQLVDGPGYDVGLKSERIVHATIQDDAAVPAGGTSLWSGTALADFTRFGGTFTTENVPAFGDVIQAVIDTQPASIFNAQLNQTIDAPVNEGDILWVEFKVRSIGAPGEISAFFEVASSPFTKSLFQGIPVSQDWSTIQIPFYSGDTYAVGEAQFGFHLGHQIQTLQFTDFQLLTFGPPQSLAPETDFDLNNIGGSWGTAETHTVSGQTFDTAYRVNTNIVPPQFWNIQAVERNVGGVTNGDTMRIEFYARAISGATPRFNVAVQRTDTYATLFSQTINLSTSWQSYSYDIVAGDDFTGDGLQVVFNSGFEVQTAEIGGFHWTNLDNTAAFKDLPRQFPASTYVGRDGDDAWRTDADDRIKVNRQSTVTVNVVDGVGQPVDGAVVSIRQNEHDFKFGSAISAFNSKLDPNGTEQALKYQAEIKRLFNTAVVENSHKWPSFLDNRARGLEALDFAVNNGLYLRGHNVIWPSRDNMPSSVWTEYDSRVVADGETSANDWLKSTIEARIDDITGTFGSQAAEWDVVNEPFTNHDVMDILGDSVVLEWFQRIRNAEPTVKLALNDYEIFAANGSNTDHRNNFDYWLGLLANAGLLDVIGEQSHYNDSNLTDIQVLGQLIDSYNTQFSAPIAITEFDVNTTDIQLQADYLRDYMTMTFSQPAVEEFLHWGFWEDSHWLPDAALYRTDFSIKPNGQAYEDLVFGNWWSDVNGTTRTGSVTSDVFMGSYDVVVQYAGQDYLGTVDVDASGSSSVTIQLPDVNPPALSVIVADATVSERDGAAATTATVTRNSDTAAALIVTLSSDDTSELTVPTTVTIPAGQSTSAPFDVATLNDGVLDGTQVVIITATATGHEDDTSALNVTEAYDHRSSDVTIRIVDQNGSPLPNATVDLLMTDHDFTFGTQIRDGFFGITQTEFDAFSSTQKLALLPDLDSQFGIPRHTPTWTDVENYRSAVMENFNLVVPTTGMHWIALNNNGPSTPDAAINLALAAGLDVSAASVIWQRDRWPTPTEFRSAANPNPQVFYNALIADRINGLLNTYSSTGSSPNITQWKLLNEPINETYFQDTFVPAGIFPTDIQLMADYFIKAAAVRPDALFSINEYNILNSGNDDATIQYRDLINDLLAAGAPIYRIGVQAHMSRGDVTKADMMRRLDILAETGLKIEISEFDTRDDAGQLTVAEQEQIFRDLLEVAFQHEAVDGFIMWGPWDAGHWRGNGPLYDTGWNIKPEAAPWFDLVRGTWETDITGLNVDSAGEWTAPNGLFNGTYEITATDGPLSSTIDNVQLTSDGVTVITLTNLPNDYGDAPVTYPVTEADDGAAHVPTGPRLGDMRDGEIDGQPSAAADGDDNTGADEDGVMFGAIQIGQTMAGVNIELQNATNALVDVWLDFDGNGTWDPGEQILDNAPVISGLQTLNFNISADAVAGDTYARVRVSSMGDLEQTGTAADGEVEDYQVTIQAVPEVESVSINDGSASRSQVTSLTIVFSDEVDHAALSTAFTLTNIDTAEIVATVSVAPVNTGGKTTALLTFDSGASVTNRVGTGQLANSLADGNYRLDILASQVQSGANTMAADYVFGGQNAAATPNDNFFRLYGDDDGDGDTDLDDLNVSFAAALFTLDGGTGFNPGLDGDGDGDIDLDDLNVHFAASLFALRQ